MDKKTYHTICIKYSPKTNVKLAIFTSQFPLSIEIHTYMRLLKNKMEVPIFFIYLLADAENSPLHVGISLKSALKGTLSGSLSVTLADESWKSPLIEDKKYN